LPSQIGHLDDAISLQNGFGFANWCIRERRLTGNPFANVPKANVKTDRRRQRRALTEDELLRLLDTARRRPLIDRMTVRRGKRRGQAVAKLRGETRLRLELLGRERALIYKTYLLTGLRKSELASLTKAQLELDGPAAFVVLDAADEKNHEGSDIPLRGDLVSDLRGWLNDRLVTLQSDARRRGEPIPDRLPSNMPIFDIPTGLLRILNRDLKAAGIPKKDERGRTIDIHALRHTFGTHLSKGGVAPRTAQAAMRHSKIDLTMNVYTDPRLLDVHGALDALPAMPLESKPARERIVAKATGTDDKVPLPFAPGFAPTRSKPCDSLSIVDKVPTERRNLVATEAIDASACGVNAKQPPSITDNDCSEVGDTGFEPVTSTMSI
jgi:integrase